MKRILIAGGMCGTTMLRAAELIKEECLKIDIYVDVKIHNLWESAYVDTSCDVVIEMFPFFDKLPVPLLSGKPFISRKEENKLIKEIVNLLMECKK